MLDDTWTEHDKPVSDKLLADALRHMKRQAAYGGHPQVLFAEDPTGGRVQVSMLALALELARARGLDALAKERVTERDDV